MPTWQFLPEKSELFEHCLARPYCPHNLLPTFLLVYLWSLDIFLLFKFDKLNSMQVNLNKTHLADYESDL